MQILIVDKIFYVLYDVCMMTKEQPAPFQGQDVFIGVRVARDYHVKLKVLAAKHGISMRRLMFEAAENYIKKLEAQKENKSTHGI